MCDTRSNPENPEREVNPHDPDLPEGLRIETAPPSGHEPPPTKSEFACEEVPKTDDPFVAQRSRSRARRAALAAGSHLASALVGLLVGVFFRPAESSLQQLLYPQNATAIRINDDKRSVQLLDSQGQPLRRVEFDATVETAYLYRRRGNDNNLLFVGLGDGGRDRGLLVASSPRGKRLWVRNPYPEGALSGVATVDEFGRPIQPATSGFLSVQQIEVAVHEKEDVIAIRAREPKWALSRVQLIRPDDGGLLYQFSHPGAIRALIIDDFDRDGDSELLMSGVNNNLGELVRQEIVKKGLCEPSPTVLPNVALLVDPRAFGHFHGPFTRFPGSLPAEIPWVALGQPIDAELQIAINRGDSTSPPCVLVNTALGISYTVDYTGHLLQTLVADVWWRFSRSTPPPPLILLRRGERGWTLALQGEASQLDADAILGLYRAGQPDLCAVRGLLSLLPPEQPSATR